MFPLRLGQAAGMGPRISSYPASAPADLPVCPRGRCEVVRRLVCILLPICFVLVVTALAFANNGSAAVTSVDTTAYVQHDVRGSVLPGHTPTGPQPTIVVGAIAGESERSSYVASWLLLLAIALIAAVGLLLIGSWLQAPPGRRTTRMRGASVATPRVRHVGHLRSRHA